MIVQSAIEVQRVCLQVEVNPDPETVPVPLATTLEQILLINAALVIVVTISDPVVIAAANWR